MSTTSGGPVKIAFFDAKRFERAFFDEANEGHGHWIRYLEPRLTAETARLAEGCPAVCSFVNDHVNRRALEELKAVGVRLIALRCAGFNHVDLQAAADLGIRVLRVPAYSPYAVAEHAVALLMTLNRKLHRAHARVHELNFSLDGLVGMDLHGKTVGVIGTGKIGSVFARIMQGFGCRVLAYDTHENPEILGLSGARYAQLGEVLQSSDVISLHVPLTPETRHLIDASALELMRPGAILINTGRGALVDAEALIHGLKSGRLGGACLDVYEEEESIFFRDLSDQILEDDILARLLTFPNVLITSHQAFLTREALQSIAETTLCNVSSFFGNTQARSWRTHAQDAECLA